MGTIFIFVGVWDYCVNVYEIVSFVVDSLDETDGVLYMFFFIFVIVRMKMDFVISWLKLGHVGYNIFVHKNKYFNNYTIERYNLLILISFSIINIYLVIKIFSFYYFISIIIIITFLFYIVRYLLLFFTF